MSSPRSSWTIDHFRLHHQHHEVVCDAIHRLGNDSHVQTTSRGISFRWNELFSSSPIDLIGGNFIIMLAQRLSTREDCVYVGCDARRYFMFMSIRGDFFVVLVYRFSIF